MALQAAISSSAPSASSLASLGSAGSFSTPFGALVGAGMSGIGMIANAVSSRKAFKRQKELMQLQARLNYEYNRTQTAEQYKWQRKGLESANYNPLLALQGANSVSAQNWSGAPSSPMADFSGLTGDFSNAMSAISSRQQLFSQIQSTLSNIDLNRSMADKARNESQSAAMDTLLKDIDYKYRDTKNQWEIDNLVKNSTFLEKQAAAAESNAESHRILAENNTKLVSQQVELMKKQGILNDSQTQQIEQMMKFYGPKFVLDALKPLLMVLPFLAGGKYVKNLIQPVGTSGGNLILPNFPTGP